ncbi:MAG: phosphodiester glycosidase family protein [Roseateles sp.]|uniref:phosphodiester glycosidase family protein n=1 Tax=Roseateles sp. TaxID=1971397 RepID=UPI0039EAD010
MSIRSLSFVALIFISTSSHSTPPFAPRPVAKFDISAPREANTARLKILIASDGSHAENGIVVGGVTVCSRNECVKSYTENKLIDLSHARNGQAREVIDLTVPIMDVESILFDSVAGGKTVEGKVNLDSPLKLSNDIEGGEVLVLLGDRSRATRRTFSPTSAVGLIFSSKRESIYYNPKSSISAHLKLGTRIDIPAGATKRAQIFSVAIHDTGDNLPLVDIFPVINLDAPIRVSSRRTVRTTMGRTPDIGANQDSSSHEITRTIPSTGVLRMTDSPARSLGSPSAGMVSAAAVTDNCAAFLNNHAQLISYSLATTGTVYVKGCESTAPFVHIAIANNADPRERLTLRYNKTGFLSQLNLQPIESLGTGSQVALNGFTWVGDTGIGGGKGYVRGFVQYNEEVLGSNRVNGGTEGVFDGNKLTFLIQPSVLPRWKEGSQPPLWTTGLEGVNYPYTVASSSTSILKNGVCTGDTTSNQWSAFGTTPTNRLIFISSTSTGSTSAAELCAVFQALGANYAIRLDGSTATGMTVDGIRKNPITGASSFIYGSSRHIAYALTMVYPSGSPDSTPVIEATTINPPKDPCKIRPAACS